MPVFALCAFIFLGVLRAFIFLRVLRAFSYLRALHVFIFFYMPLVPSLFLRAFTFLRAFFFYVFYILFMYTLIKLTQINGFTYDCSSLLLLKSLNV